MVSVIKHIIHTGKKRVALAAAILLLICSIQVTGDAVHAADLTEKVSLDGGLAGKTLDEDETFDWVDEDFFMGSWKSVGSYGIGVAQPGASVIFDGDHVGLVSPWDTYRFYKVNGEWKLTCQTAVFSDDLFFEVKIIDENHVNLIHNKNYVTELERVGTYTRSNKRSDKNEPQGPVTEEDGEEVTEQPDVPTETVVIPQNQYMPYKIITLKSVTNHKYVSCDIGNKQKSGKYEHYYDPRITLTADKAQWYEKFYLVPLTGKKYALQSLANMKYVSVTGTGMLLGVMTADWADKREQFTMEKNGSRVRFYNPDTKCYLYENGTTVGASGDGHENSWFEKTEISTGTLSDTEKNILSNGCWFNLDGKKVGFVTVQQEIGKEKTVALEKLGYTPMYNKGQKKPEGEQYYANLNNRVAVGVKKRPSGVFDVLVCFQGTDDLIDVFTNLTDSVYDGQHKGYRGMALNHFANDAKNIIAPVDGKNMSLKTLQGLARRGEAHFTILGHSMGGAIAQCYAIYLNKSYEVPKSSITGRTFNSALAVTYDDPEFTDWYNMCVTSDTVCRGLVPSDVSRKFKSSSIADYGIHRLGQTIWLYDDEANNNIDDKDLATNISNNKHIMDDGKPLQKIIKYYAERASVQVVPLEDRYMITNRSSVVVNKDPLASSDEVRKIEERGTMVKVTGYTYNGNGNKWYRVNGGYIYVEHLTSVDNMPPDAESTFSVAVENAKVRNDPASTGKVIAKLQEGTGVEIKHSICDANGKMWHYVDVEGKLGWMEAAHVQCGVSGIQKRLEVRCPIAAKLVDSKGNVVASISEDGKLSTEDETKVAPYLIGNIKMFDIATDEEYHIQVDSLSDGYMDYIVYGDFNKKDGGFESAKVFDSVELEEKKQFSSSIGGGLNTADIELGVVGEDGKTTENIEGKAQTVDLGKRRKTIFALILIFSIFILIILVVTIVTKVHRKKERKRREAMKDREKD